jgi:hypothetical protein
MKPRHAGALALMGWYLMLPPIMTDGRVDSSVRLAQWRIDEDFDSAAQCDHMREALQHVTVLARRAGDPPMQLEIAADHKAICIATDDPRLKDR